jgi:hypothetical protein
MAAFGDSCRRRGHALVSLTDPLQSCRQKRWCSAARCRCRDRASWRRPETSLPDQKCQIRSIELIQAKFLFGAMAPSARVSRACRGAAPPGGPAGTVPTAASVPRKFQRGRSRSATFLEGRPATFEFARYIVDIELSDLGSDERACLVRFRIPCKGAPVRDSWSSGRGWPYVGPCR